MLLTSNLLMSRAYARRAFQLSFMGVHVTKRQTHNEFVSFLPDASKTGFSSVNRSATPVLRKRKNLQKIALYTTSIQTRAVQLYRKHGFKVVSKGGYFPVAIQPLKRVDLELDLDLVDVELHL